MPYQKINLLIIRGFILELYGKCPQTDAVRTVADIDHTVQLLIDGKMVIDS